ncbi:14814_t:CDS:2, partial [Acaulospora morrowiae]
MPKKQNSHATISKRSRSTSSERSLNGIAAKHKHFLRSKVRSDTYQNEPENTKHLSKSVHQTPKRRRVTTPSTPTTPKRRHVTTPSTPTTPKRRRVTTPSTPTTPNSKGLITPISETTSCYLTPKSTRTVDLLKRSSSSSPTEVIGEAKLLFRLSTVPTKLVGRNNEREAITEFLKSNIIGGTPGSLYITGAPGTGKTALVNEVWNSMKDTIKKEARCSVEFIMINCMNVDEPKRIYTKLLDNLGYDTAKNAEEALDNLFLKSKKKLMYVVLLDEIDSLMTVDQEVIYRLFEWSTVKSSRLVLIGISNRPELTERYLPRLKIKNILPKVINFSAYSASEIVDIVKDRITVARTNTGDSDSFSSFLSSQDSDVSLIQDQAIELCAKRVASSNGDCRKALDVFRKAMELAETEIEESETNLSIEDKIVEPTPSENLHFPKKSIVTISHINQITNTDVTGTHMVKRLRELTVHQLLIICTCIIMKIKKIKKVTYDELRSEYLRLCRKDNLVIPSVSSEFHVLVERLEKAGLIKVRPAKAKATRTIRLLVEESDFMVVAKDHPVLIN